MAAEFIKLVEKRLGIEFSVDLERSWPEMITAVKNRDLDAFSLVVQTPQRDEYVNFTKPYISFPMVIVTLDNASYIDGLTALNNRTVSIVKSYASHELLAKNHPDLDLNPVDSVREGLESVSHGEAYAFVGNLAVTNQVMREVGITNVKISGQTQYRFELSMAVRSDWPELIPILQKALDSITLEERQDIFDRWIHIKLASEVGYSFVLAIVGISSLIVVIILVWNRKLGNEVLLRTETENLLEDERTRLDEIIRGTNVGTWEWNLQTGEAVFSERWAQIMGYTLEELMPGSEETWKKLGHQDDMDEVYVQLEKVFSNEMDYFRCDYRMRHKNGEYVWVNSRGKVVERDANNVPLRMSGTYSDITDRKEAEISLRDSQEELQRYVIELDSSRRDLEKQAVEVAELADAQVLLNDQLQYEDDVKNRFFSIIAHDLKSPFTILLGMTKMMSQMSDKFSKEQLVEYANDVNTAGERVYELLQNLLEWSRLQMDGAKLEQEMLSLRKLTEESIELLGPIATEKGVALSNELEDEAAFADEDMVSTVLRNLIANSIKFTRSGGVVTVLAENLENTVKITVSDTGIGMSEEQIKHVFSLDQKTSTTGTAGEMGTGLGLPLCKDMIERNGGSIRVTSTEGTGTQFQFTLPNRGVNDAA